MPSALHAPSTGQISTASFIMKSGQQLDCAANWFEPTAKNTIKNIVATRNLPFSIVAGNFLFTVAFFMIT
jgi:hypothetical protein